MVKLNTAFEAIKLDESCVSKECRRRKKMCLSSETKIPRQNLFLCSGNKYSGVNGEHLGSVI